MSNGWTEERRKKQSELIQTWKPWKQSTGPKTIQGKANAAQNAYKGGVRPMIRQLGRLLREQEDTLERF